MFECCRPCKPPKRKPGCQDHCPEYIAAKAKYNELKAADDKARGRNTATVYQQRADSVRRANKRKPGPKY
jgi:hypothetical protein